MRSKKGKDKGRQKKIACERIEILFGKVYEAASEGDLAQADSLIMRAREIGMKTNARIPRKYKRLFCKHCYRFTQSSKRSRSRVDSENNRVVVKCLLCGKKMFYPLKGSQACKDSKPKD